MAGSFRAPELKDAKPESGLNFLLAMPISELYRLVVDGALQKEGLGYVHYEQNEPGSIGNVLRAILEGHELLTQHSTLSVELFKEIHKICRDGLHLPEVPSGKFIDKTEHGFPVYQVSVDGLKDWCLFARKYPEIKVHTFDFPEGIDQFKIYRLLNSWRLAAMFNRGSVPSQFLYIVDLTEALCEKLIKAIIADCNAAMQRAKTDDELIQAIVDCIHDLEHVHPYKDVNLRSCMVVANILLMQHGFPPVTYFDPNFLDGCSKVECFDIIKKGMLKTLDIIENPSGEHFGVKTAELKLSPEQREMYKGIVAPVLEAKKGVDVALEPGKLLAMRARILSLKSVPEPVWVLDHGRFNAAASSKFEITVMLPQRKVEKKSFEGEDKMPVVVVGSVLRPEKKESVDRKGPVEVKEPLATKELEKKMKSDESKKELPPQEPEEGADAADADDEERGMDIYFGCMVEWVEKRLGDEEMYQAIFSLGDVHQVLNAEGETLVSLAEEAGVSEAVINRLKGEAGLRSGLK